MATKDKLIEAAEAKVSQHEASRTRAMLTMVENRRLPSGLVGNGLPGARIFASANSED